MSLYICKIKYSGYEEMLVSFIIPWTMVSFKPWAISRESTVHGSFLHWRCRYRSCVECHRGHSMNSRSLYMMQSHFSFSEIWYQNTVTITLNFFQTCKLKSEVQFSSCISLFISRNYIKEITNDYARKAAYKLVAVNYNSFQ